MGSRGPGGSAPPIRAPDCHGAPVRCASSDSHANSQSDGLATDMIAIFKQRMQSVVDELTSGRRQSGRKDAKCKCEVRQSLGRPSSLSRRLAALKEARSMSAIIVGEKISGTGGAGNALQKQFPHLLKQFPDIAGVHKYGT